ncbi:MAK10-like protein [Tanacetum coccineum]
MSHQGKVFFTFRERVHPNPQPQALGTTFEARVRDYMAAHTKRMGRFENAIFKRREEINDRMTEMFRLLKELTTNRAPENEEMNEDDDATTGDSIERPDRSDAEMQLKEVEKENEAENKTKNEPIKITEKELTRAEEEEAVEAPSSQPVGYYLKHRINEKLIEGLVENHRGLVYEGILKKKITKKEDIGGNFRIPCNIGGLKHMNSLVDQGSNDVLVDVARYVYPVDFVILDIKEDEKRPFILGTPFLTTSKAMIKFDKGTITLKTGKSKMSFHRIPESPCKIERGIKNDIEPISPTMTVNRLVLEWEEKIKLHQEKEMEFDQ